MKTQLKTALMKKMLTAKKKKEPFHEKLSELYTLPENAPDHYNNSYYFSGHSVSGESLFLRLGLRNDHFCEVWCAYKNGDTFYANPKTLYETGEALPLTVSCLETSKRWKVTYQGPMQDQHQPDRCVQAKLSCIFTAGAPIFDFSYHMNPTTLARAMANEKWSKSFFAELKENSQTHYEQPGDMTGTLMLGEREIPIALHTVRDHSFGKRDWDYMNKHYWLMALMENGDMLNVSMVSYPAMHQLDAGNVVINGKAISLVQVIPHGDLIQEGKGPDHLHMTCVLENGRKLNLYAKKEGEIVYPLGNGYVLREGLGTFSVDGRKARGIMEFGFHHDWTRW
ncbi:MAG: hypothetical protein PUC32_03885 [Oscillospiraceae bacterium]|nr:hypothetical protein [Oscillospiraceae bacterium]